MGCRTMFVALALAGACSRSGGGEPVDCPQAVARLRSWTTGPPTGAIEGIARRGDVDPTITLPESATAAGIPAGVVVSARDILEVWSASQRRIHHPAPTPGEPPPPPGPPEEGVLAYRDADDATDKRPYRLDEIETRLRERLGRHKGPLYVAADRAAPPSVIERVRRVLPAGAELRLLVARPRSAWAEVHLRAFPRTPAEIAQLIRNRPELELDDDDVIAALERASRGCPEALRTAQELVKAGAGPDVIGSGVAERLDQCRCRAEDLHGLESLLAYAIMPRGDLGWAPPEPAGEGAVAGDDAAAPAPSSKLERLVGETRIEPPPVVKADMARRGIAKVTAIIKLCVAPTGAIKSMEVTRPSGFPAWDLVIVTRMKEWKYRPFVTNGTAVCAPVTFVYNLQ